MYDRPPLLALEYFVATCEAGTVRAAADALHVTPSAVSHQIGKLEDFLNAKLFDRHKRRLLLTEAGRRYYDQLNGALSQIGQATRDVSRRQRRKYLRVSCPPTFLALYLTARLTSLLEQEPELTLSFEDSLTLNPLRDDLDCAIEYRVQPDERFHSTKLFDDTVVVVSTPEYAEKMQLQSLEDVRRCVLIGTQRRAYSWDNVLRNYPWRNRCRMLFMQYTYQAMASVLEGQGIALANTFNTEHLLRSGQLVIPFPIELRSYISPGYYFSTLPSKQAQPGVLAFHSWLNAEIADSRAKAAFLHA